MSFPRVSAFSGLASPLVLAGASLAFGALRPTYSPVAQTISELAEVGAPHSAEMVVAGFLLPGALMAIFGYGMMRSFGQGGKLALRALPFLLVGLGWFGAGVFPCGPCRGNEYNTTTSLHYLFASILEFSIVIQPFALRRRLADPARWPAWFPRYSLVTGFVIIVIYAMLTSSFGVAELMAYSGAFQRMFFAVFFVWMAGVALPFARGIPATKAAAPS